MFTLPRVRIIQHYLDQSGGKRYLEIGVEKGDSFFPINAKEKIAVDPAFGISDRVREKRARYRESYFQMTSDVFFRQHAQILENGIDIAFIDGCHSYEQSLRDVENCLSSLNKDGVILMHDCNPTTTAMAYPASSWNEARNAQPQGWNGDWCGDVWKTIVHLRSTRADLEVSVLDTDFGIGVVKKGYQELLPFTSQQIDDMGYDLLTENRKKLLRLQVPEHLLWKIPHLSQFSMVKHVVENARNLRAVISYHYNKNVDPQYIKSKAPNKS